MMVKKNNNKFIKFLYLLLIFKYSLLLINKISFVDSYIKISICF